MRSPLPRAFSDHVILGTRVSEPTASGPALTKAARLTQDKGNGPLRGGDCVITRPPVTINYRLSARRLLPFLYLKGTPKLGPSLGVADDVSLKAPR